jgi:putative tryptophan/tyrosine transport system substrate-binding protein
MKSRVLSVFVFSIVCIFIITGLSAVAAVAEKKIGVILFNDQPRYVETQRGIVDYLKQQGFTGPNYTYTIMSAKGSKARALAVVRQFAAERMNLVVAIGTGAAVPAAREIRDIPIVFSMVYDPVETNIAKSWKSSGNNTTGSATKLPMSRVISVLLELAPVKKLAVLYTPGERNSELQLRELQKIQNHLKIRIIPVILGKEEEAVSILAQVVKTSDAVYLTGSSVVGATVPVIAGFANRAGVVTVTHLDDLVEKGALLGVSPNSYDVGLLAGKKAVRILKGTRPSAIQIEVGDKIDIILNMKSAGEGKFNISGSFLNKVTKKIE